MPRITKSKTRDMLPVQAQGLTPVGGYPIVIDNKTKLDFECDACSLVIEKSWNQLSNNTVKEHCPCCKTAKADSEKFLELYPDYSLMMFAHDKHASGALGVSTNPPSYVFQHHCGVKRAISHAQMKSLISAKAQNSKGGERLLKCSKCEQKEDLDDISRKAIAAWGPSTKISIEDGKYLINVPDLTAKYRTGIVAIDALVGGGKGRLKGELKESLSRGQLQRILNDDKRTIERTLFLRDSLEKIGLRLIGVAYRGDNGNPMYSPRNTPESVPKKKEVYYQYEKAEGSISSWEVYSRVVKSNDLSE